MPSRRCIFCKKSKEKNDLIRIVNINNELIFDKNQKINARGIYFCDKTCMEKYINLNKKKKSNINLNEEKLEEILKTIN